jgi:hypothetical protein
MDCAQECIEALNGADFRLWSYTASHDRLTVALKGSGLGDKLEFLFCSELYYKNPIKFVSPKLIVKEKSIILKGTGFEIKCLEITRVNESGDPLWSMNFQKDGKFSCSQTNI